VNTADARELIGDLEQIAAADRPDSMAAFAAVAASPEAAIGVRYRAAALLVALQDIDAGRVPDVGSILAVATAVDSTHLARLLTVPGGSHG
jgi:hypothetical protein